MDQAGKIYTRRIFIVSVVYIFLLLASRGAMSAMENSPLRTVLGLLPILPVGLGVVALMSFVRNLDEMQQKIQLEAMAFSLGVTGLITFAFGLVEGTGVPSVSMIWVFPMIVFFWGFGLIVAKRRYE